MLGLRRVLPLRGVLVFFRRPAVVRTTPLRWASAQASSGAEEAAEEESDDDFGSIPPPDNNPMSNEDIRFLFDKMADMKMPEMKNQVLDVLDELKLWAAGDRPVHELSEVAQQLAVAGVSKEDLQKLPQVEAGVSGMSESDLKKEMGEALKSVLDAGDAHRKANYQPGPAPPK